MSVPSLIIPPRSRLLTFIAGICRPYVKSKSISKMKHQKFEIAVAGYDYRFKTYARDGVEASVKVKCFLGKPDAECICMWMPSGSVLCGSSSIHRSAQSQDLSSSRIILMVFPSRLSKTKKAAKKAIDR